MTPARAADHVLEPESGLRVRPCRNGRDLPIHGQENLAMLTITIIFALLVALWGRLGVAGASRA